MYRRSLIVSAIALAVFSCNNGEGSSRATPPPAQPGFENVSGEGFTVQKPAGWRVDKVSPTRFVIHDPASQSFAAVTAMPIKGDPLDGVLYLEKWIKSAKVRSSAAPAKNLRRAELAIVDKDDKPLTARVVIVDGGGISTIYWASAPTATFATELPKLSAVLDSFRLVQGAPKPTAQQQQQQQQQQQYVQWVDPREQAFSTEIPKGWTPQGGMFRVGAIGTRVNAVISSPDNAIQIILGDMSTPRFILPSEVVCSLGNCNGQPMANGDIVAQFMHAADIGSQIIQRRFGGQPTGRRERNDIVQFRKTRQPTMGGTINAMTAADVDFKLQDGRIGTATILNSGYQVPGLGGAWSVDDFGGFIAPAERAAEAAKAYAHAVGSMHTNPQWLAAELRSQAAASEQWLAYQRDSSAMQQKVIEERWASQDKNNAAFRDALTNTVRLVDPQTHENIELQSSDRYFFRNVDPAKDLVVGTSNDDNPAPLDMRKLLER